ncbi:MAG: hypothetical protein ACKONH_12045 [Planctomycetia bacterium]
MPAPPIVQAVVRLVPSAGTEAGPPRPRCYRPLVVGPAILRRCGGSPGPWTVAVSRDGRMMPQVPASPAALDSAVARHRAAGMRCRIVTALVCPADVLSPGQRAAAGLRAEIYGWSLMWQPPGVVDRAFVDPDDAIPDLPACFELPFELMDRITFLEARGFHTRPLAVITQPEDFEAVAGGLRNRFRPDARFGRPCSPGRLL